MLKNSDKSILIRWGLKPSVMRDLGLLNCSIEECVDLVIDMIRSGRSVSSYIVGGREDWGYSLDIIRSALLDVLYDRFNNLGEALEKYSNS